VNADTACVWELASGQKMASFQLNVEQELSWTMTFTPSGEALAAVITNDQVHPWRDNALELWDVFANKRLRRIRIANSYFEHVDFAPRARWVLTSMADTSVLVWGLSLLSHEKSVQPGRLEGEDRARHWQELAGLDARRAQTVVRALTASGEAAIPFLQERLKPARPAPFSRWIADLDSDEYSVREVATRELMRSGRQASTALRDALRKGPGLEPRRRIEALLARLRNGPVPPELLRQVRAVQVLEQVGSPDGRRLLTKLARGAADSLLTQEAKASLERLGSPTSE
jgi:hypothetical protein